MTQKRKILVTSALIYANGPMHLGHIIEQIQTDIWVRFQRMNGHDCIYVSGDDAHGTPIMLAAEQLGISPEELIEQVGASHRQDIEDFHISVDNYYTTHSEENKTLATQIYNLLASKGDIETKTIEQAYDPEKNMFLPDRYVKGECPRCGAKDQYGDNCEECGATYMPAELKNPVSAISGATPIKKESLHYFFNLAKYTDMLRQWTKGGHLQKEVSNKLNEWLKSGLEAWDISRDEPYFGFNIPGLTDKYLYVWLDAPIGYMASFKNLCDKHKDLNFDEYWQPNSNTELYHFIGKDIINFHGLFWPATLKGSGYRTPTAIFTHGFLTVNGQKMSKSRGTFINARTYLNYLDAEYLRYYLAAKLSAAIDDIDLNLEDFMLRVNADLVGKVVNIASRCAGFINKGFAGQLAGELAEPKFFETLSKAQEKIANLYEQREFSHAVRLIMELADKVNQYIDEKKPWVLAKQEGQEQTVQKVCSMGLNCFRLLMIYLKPILPVMAKEAESFLNIPPLTWQACQSPLLNHKINTFKPLMSRIQQQQLDDLLEASKAETETAASRHATS